MRGNDRRRAGAGQTLALFAVVLPGLIAAMALGVDGANLALSYRDAQSAADLAALSGSRTLSATNPSIAEFNNAEARAVSVAASNGFPTGVTATAPYDVNGDGDIDDGTGAPDERHHVEVLIDSSVQMFFLPILGVSTMDLGVRALAGSEWSVAAGQLPAIYAGCGGVGGTCTDAYKAIDWSGQNNTSIGGVVSNGGALIATAPNTFTGESTANGQWNSVGGNTYSETPRSFAPDMAWPAGVPRTMADFDCTAGPTTFVKNGKLELKNYYLTGTTLKPGLYCATGSSAEIILGDSNVIGNGVTLVSNGKIEISGANFNLSYFHSSKTLMFANGQGSAVGDPVIKIAGSDGSWNGLIIAPRGQVEFSGQNTSTQGGGSVIADRVKLAGSNLYIDSFGLTTSGAPTLESLRLFE